MISYPWELTFIPNQGQNRSTAKCCRHSSTSGFWFSFSSSDWDHPSRSSITQPPIMGGATPRFWTPTTPPQLTVGRRPLGGGVLGGAKGGGLRGAFAPGGGGGEGSGRVGWLGGVEVGQFGGYMPPRPSVGPSQAPLTSLCTPSNHTITLNPTLTFAANWPCHPC